MSELKNFLCSKCKARADSIFNDLSKDDLDALDEIKKCRAIKKGELLFKEGAFPKGLYCLISGKIKISQIGHDGKEQIMHMVSEGDVMGHRALISEDVYSCTASALEDSMVCFIPKVPFFNLAEEKGKLVMKIAHLLADELKEAERKITITAQQSAHDKVAIALLFLLQNYGYERDQTTINITIKREELANLAGTSRETATRQLYKLQEEKLIKIAGKKIRILDESRLLKFNP